jgi:membrane associated rhomboid family serine protease
MLRITEVVKHLLIINVLIFLADQIVGLDHFALFYPTSPNFQPYQIVTHFFMHGNLMHLFFNMFALVMFGSALEQLWGPKRFLFFYIFCALGGAVLHTLANYYQINALENAVSLYQAAPSHEAYFNFFNEHENLKKIFTDFGREQYRETALALKDGVDGAAQASALFIQQIADVYGQGIASVPVVGASGAIFGLLLGFGMLFPNMELMLLFFPVPIKAKYFIPIMMGIELFLGVNQFSWDNIAHFAHLGGALFGFLLIWFWQKTGVGMR